MGDLLRTIKEVYASSCCQFYGNIGEYNGEQRYESLLSGTQQYFGLVLAIYEFGIDKLYSDKDIILLKNCNNKYECEKILDLVCNVVNRHWGNKGAYFACPVSRLKFVRDFDGFKKSSGNSPHFNGEMKASHL